MPLYSPDSISINFQMDFFPFEPYEPKSQIFLEFKNIEVDRYGKCFRYTLPYRFIFDFMEFDRIRRDNRHDYGVFANDIIKVTPLPGPTNQYLFLQVNIQQNKTWKQKTKERIKKYFEKIKSRLLKFYKNKIIK